MKLKAGSDSLSSRGDGRQEELRDGVSAKGGPALAAPPGPSTPEAVASPEVAAAVSLQDKGAVATVAINHP